MLLPKRFKESDSKARKQLLNTGVFSFKGKLNESVAVRKDGTEFPVEICISDWKVNDRRYFTAILRDITERKQHEEALRESEERFRTIAESSPDAIITADSGGKIIYWNKAAETLYGYKAKEIVRKSIELLRPEVKRLVDRENREKFVKTGHSPYIGKTVEGLARRKDGTQFLTETSTSHWKVGDQIFFSGIVRDITERKLLENSLEQEKHFSNSVINSLPGIFYLLDAQGHRIRWNKNLETVTGYSAKELQNLDALALIHEDDKALIAGTIKEVFANGQSEVEARLSGRHGKAIPYFFTGRRLEIEGKSYLAGVGIDITERKRMEKALEKAHAELEKKVLQRTAALKEANEKLQLSEKYLKKFAGLLLSAREEERKTIATNIHDELGSMAIAVDSQISIAKEECNENNKQATFKALTNAQAALRKAVEDLRRLAVDLRPPNLEIMGLNAAVTDFIDRAKEQAKFNIIFRNELGNKKISEDTAIVIYRVIQEALTNITKHAKAQKMSIRLHSDNNRVHLDITDDGVGFEVDNVSKRKGMLKIGIEGMKERVESLGGEFTITSTPKRGTQLKATLPNK
jgi:PAS domain S-box-containing protein